MIQDMTKFRTLYPETESPSLTRLLPKLERAFILCEILQSSSSIKFLEQGESNAFYSHFSEISFPREDIGGHNDQDLQIKEIYKRNEPYHRKSGG